MCGRFIVSYSYEDLVKIMSKSFDLFDLDPEIDVPRYNVAPGQQILSVISDGKNYRLGTFKWGFIPFFAKDKNIGYKMINARSEGISEKASFRESFKKKRCLILANGYYEWQKEGKRKLPYLIQKEDKNLFFFPGVWSTYRSEEETIHSTAIITIEANEELKDIHHRMPIILNEEKAKLWLNKDIHDKDHLNDILLDNDNHGFIKTRVSSYVNSVSNEGPQCIEEVVENSLFG